VSRKLLVGAAVGLAAIVAGVLVLVTALGGGGNSTTPSASVVGGADTAALLRGIPQHGNVLGSPKAPVTLVEYADLQCPYCGEWARQALPEVVHSYMRTGKVRLVFNGMAFVGPDSETGLRAALAAGRQNRLFHVLDLLYRNQGQENTGWVRDSLLRGIGAAVPGLDVTRMLEESGSPAVAAAQSAAAEDAVNHGINSTPSFLAGPTGGTLRPVQVAALDASGITPALDRLLAR
jgi:protein-disulfide isomerase